MISLTTRSDVSGSGGRPISEVEVVGSRNLKNVCESKTNFSCWSLMPMERELGSGV
jgi:hypothetical protein